VNAYLPLTQLVSIPDYEGCNRTGLSSNPQSKKFGWANMNMDDILWMIPIRVTSRRTWQEDPQFKLPI
jgi:hypothetical protein